MKISVVNYRNFNSNFEDIELEIGSGITFILGPNNVGKSSLINFFFYFKELFQYNNFYGDKTNFSIKLQQCTFDQLVYRGKRDILAKSEISIKFTNENEHSVTFKVSPANSNLNSAEVLIEVGIVNVPLQSSEMRSLLQEICRMFKECFCIGVYRTPLSIATGDSLDLSIGSQFIRIWSSWADGPDIRKREQMENLKDELKLLLGYSRFEIRSNDDKNNLIVTNDDGVFLLSELGSGISQFIIVLSKALMNRPSFIVIDEPETSLHPKMQEIFVRALASKSKYGLFAVSHSIGLARSVGDRVYMLTRKSDNTPMILPFDKDQPSITQAISEMSFSQQASIGTNNILLVEGKTDIKSFKEILRKYKIDDRFVIFSFGGTQFIANSKEKIIDELRELQKLKAQSVSFIFDSEYSFEGDDLKEKFKIFIEVCNELGYHIFPTDRHSTENYITQTALDRVLDGSYKALMPYENFKAIAKRWPKEKNWLMFREMDKGDFIGTGLDKFIRDTLSVVSIPMA